MGYFRFLRRTLDVSSPLLRLHLDLGHPGPSGTGTSTHRDSTQDSVVGGTGPRPGRWKRLFVWLFRTSDLIVVLKSGY